MPFELFGFQFLKKKEEEKPVSFVPPKNDDGALVVETGSGFGFYGQYVNLDGTIRSDKELIYRYREMGQQFEVDNAICDIVNEAIISTVDEQQPIKLDLDEIDNSIISPKVKKTIVDEFKIILDLLEFSKYGPDIFRSWYVDSRIYFQILIDTENPKDGIKELRFIDPTKIVKVIENKKEKNESGVDIITDTIEYFVYSPESQDVVNTAQSVRIPADSVVYSTSGMFDTRNARVVGHLHKAIKPLNQLRMMEDALVIYRVSRAPERRVFYIDVGNLPKTKAEQYVRDIMNRYKNKLVYDSSTGEIRDDKRIQTMLEDFWMPRREGGKGTEITTLQGGQNLGELTDVEYFKKKLYNALKVPISRLDNEKPFQVGRSTEITRDEVKFSKFINSLRVRFSDIFLQALKTQLLLKNIITQEDWDKIVNEIRFEYAKDSYFSELKELEILNERTMALNGLQPMIGTFYSKQWIQENILKMTEEEIEEMAEQIKQEREDDPEGFAAMNPAFAGPMGMDGGMGMGGMGGGMMPGMGQPMMDQGFQQPQEPQPQSPRPKPASKPKPKKKTK